MLVQVQWQPPIGHGLYRRQMQDFLTCLKEEKKENKNYMSTATRLYKCDGNLGLATVCTGVLM